MGDRQTRRRLPIYVALWYCCAIAVFWALFFRGPSDPSAPSIAMFMLVINLPGSVIALPAAEWLVEQIDWAPTSAGGLWVLQIACTVANLGIGAVLIRLLHGRRVGVRGDPRHRD